MVIFGNVNLVKEQKVYEIILFFSNSNLSIAKIIKVLYKIACGIKQVTIANDLNISENIVSSLMEKLRHLCIESITGEDSKIGGLDDLGYPKVVEIDENLFFKRKYERGRIKNGNWYVSGIERGTNNSFIVPVDTRGFQYNSSDNHKSYKTIYHYNF